MSPADIVEKAKRCGIDLALNDAGTGLSLSADRAPPQVVVDLIRDARDALVAHLQQKRAIRAWINDNLTPGKPGVCMHCGRHWLADESIIMVCCGADCGDLHEACWEAWEADQDRRARKSAGVRMTGAEIIRVARKQGVEAEVFLGKLCVHAESEPDEALVRLLRHNRQAVIDAFLEAETEPDRWRRLLAEKIEIVVKMRRLPRPEAERVAYEIVLVEFLDRAHPNTPSDRCAWCGQPGTDGDALLPIGVGARHAWLHSDCWAPWRERRRTEAIAMLAGMGITP